MLPKKHSLLCCIQRPSMFGQALKMCMAVYKVLQMHGYCKTELAVLSCQQQD